MKLLKLALLGALFTVGASVAHADLLVEPYAGYGVGTYKLNSTNSDVTSPVIGARLGYSGTLIDFGIDGSTMTGGKIKSGSSSADVTSSSIGAFIGIGVPLFHFWAGYGFSDTFKAGSSGTDFKGNNVKVGVGFRGLPFVSLNVEYIMKTYDHSLTGNLLLVSLSLPLTF